VLSILLKRGLNGSKDQAQVYLSAGSTDYKKIELCGVTASRELIFRIIRIYYENFQHYNIYDYILYESIIKVIKLDNITLFCLICVLSNTKFMSHKLTKINA